MLSEVEREKAYKREYYLAHKDEILANRRKYYQTHKAEARVYGKDWRQTHKAEIATYHRDYYQTYRDKLLNGSKEWGRTHKSERRVICKKYRQTHKMRIAAHDKEYQRRTQIATTINGKSVRFKAPNKRPWPVDGICEVCGEIPKHLAYHHWDDDDFSKGVWVCFNCHWACEGVDSGRDELYRRWRRTFDQGIIGTRIIV